LEFLNFSNFNSRCRPLFSQDFILVELLFPFHAAVAVADVVVVDVIERDEARLLDPEAGD